MKMLTLLLLTVMMPLGHADSSEYEAGFAKLPEGTMRAQFRLRGELFILDREGKKFLSTTSEEREWHAGVKSNKIESEWTVSAKGFKTLAMRNLWVIQPDNSIDVLIQQCDAIKNGRCAKIIREERHPLENFAPITWVAETTENARVVVRLTPIIQETRNRESSDRITIGGDRGSFEVFDNQGYMWSPSSRFGGVISGLKTVRGSLVFSLYPFPGARELGHASGKILELNVTDTLTVTIRNDRDVIPGEARVKVYGRYLPKLKAQGLQSAYSFGHEKAETIPEEFR